MIFDFLKKNKLKLCVITQLSDFYQIGFEFSLIFCAMVRIWLLRKTILTQNQNNTPFTVIQILFLP